MKEKSLTWSGDGTVSVLGIDLIGGGFTPRCCRRPRVGAACAPGPQRTIGYVRKCVLFAEPFARIARLFAVIAVVVVVVVVLSVFPVTRQRRPLLADGSGSAHGTLTPGDEEPSRRKARVGKVNARGPASSRVRACVRVSVYPSLSLSLYFCVLLGSTRRRADARMTSGEETGKSVMNVETVYREVNSRHGWASFYQDIRSECESYDYTCNESKKPQNKNLNRYRDVAPYDHTRIILKRGPSDYIHANLIRVDRAERQYILTQGPLPNTVSHFWLMVWEQNSRAVLMLNKIIEKNQIKCHQYFPLDDIKPTLTFEDVSIKVDYISKKDSSDYTTRTLRITDLESNDSREILHFHYTTWPDFGVPQRPTAFLRFLADVRKSGALDQNVGPPIVHCSAGIGRSGTFCLVDACLVLIEKYGLNALDVRHELMEMRRFRMGLIQTPEQLCFSYAAIIQGATQLPLDNMDMNNETTQDEIITYDEMNNKNHPLEKDDEPPPLPPPRGESLTRSNMMADSSSEGSTDNDNDEIGGPPDKPLPSEPPNHVELSADANLSISTNCVGEQNIDDGTVLDETLSDDAENSIITNNSPSNSDAKGEVRRRKTEKNERLATQVREMKRRQKEMEERQKFKRSKSETTESGESVHEEAESTI